MALEINEIELKMRVGEEAQEKKPTKNTNLNDGCCDPDYHAIVAECTRKVLQRLAELQAR